MRKVIVQEFTTIDGFAAGANAELDFIANSTDVDATAGEETDDQLRFIETIDTILLGAVTYRMFRRVLARADHRHRAHRGCAERHSQGRLLADARTGAVGEVGRLKREQGKDMVVWGSISLVQSLMNEGLVDEYRLWVCPILLGEGKRLFASPETRKMDWLGTTSYAGGVVSVRFQPLTG